jgi:hypothetical protein
MCWWCKFGSFHGVFVCDELAEYGIFRATIARFENFCVQKMAHDDALD